MSERPKITDQQNSADKAAFDAIQDLVRFGKPQSKVVRAQPSPHGKAVGALLSKPESPSGKVEQEIELDGADLLLIGAGALLLLIVLASMIPFPSHPAAWYWHRLMLSLSRWSTTSRLCWGVPLTLSGVLFVLLFVRAKLKRNLSPTFELTGSGLLLIGAMGLLLVAVLVVLITLPSWSLAWYWRRLMWCLSRWTVSWLWWGVPLVLVGLLCVLALIRARQNR